jgi:hypothetical protein
MMTWFMLNRRNTALAHLNRSKSKRVLDSMMRCFETAAKNIKIILCSSKNKTSALYKVL